MIMKKALFLCSSPRKDSNTNKVAKIVENLLIEKNINCDFINLATLKYATNGCIDCGGCQKSEKYECVIKDEASEILKQIPTYDFIIFATPVYFFGPNAQLKLFLDRMQCLYKFHEKGHSCCIEHIKAGLIATSGGGINLGLSLLDETIQTMCKYTKVPYSSILVPKVKEKNLDGDEIIEQAIKFVNEVI